MSRQLKAGAHKGASSRGGHYRAGSESAGDCVAVLGHQKTPIWRCIAARKAGPFDLEVFEARAVAERVIEFAKQPTDIVQIDRASGFNWGHRFGHDSSMVPAM